MIANFEIISSQQKSVEIHSDSKYGSYYTERCRWILGSSYIYAGLVWEKLWGMIEWQNIFQPIVYLQIVLKASFIRYLMKFKISLLFRALYFCVSKLLCCSNYSLFNVGYILHRWVLEYHHEPKHDSSGHLWTLECSPSGPREEVSILKRQTSSKNDFLIKM